jgi:serine phosphatase RsbU (regulator of sigma subunit)
VLVGLGVPTLATALVCRIEQGDGDLPEGVRRLRWASAGHPEPLLLRADGTVRDLSAPVGPPLGIGWRGPRADGVALLEPGSTVLLFTDGLFERRGVPLDEGRDQVRSLLARSVGRSLENTCDRILQAMVGDGAEDDVAILAVRAHPVDVHCPEEGALLAPQLVEPR